MAAPTSTEGYHPTLGLEWPPACGAASLPGSLVSCLSWAPAPLPGLVSLELKHSALSPPLGSDPFKAGFLCRRLTGPASKRRAVGQPLGQSPVDNGTPGEASSQRGHFFSPCGFCAWTGSPCIGSRELPWFEEHLTKGHGPGRAEESCRDGVCWGGRQGVCVLGGSKGLKPQATCQHLPPAEPNAAHRQPACVRLGQPPRPAGAGGPWA